MVGASLAGLRAAESLAAHSADMHVTVLGDEPLAPYSRPPLSKGYLSGTSNDDALGLRQRMPGDPRILWRLGTAVVSTDLDRRDV